MLEERGGIVWVRTPSASPEPELRKGRGRPTAEAVPPEVRAAEEAAEHAAAEERVAYDARQLAAFQEWLERQTREQEEAARRAQEEREQAPAGPELPQQFLARAAAPLDYGKALLPGEGDAMAAFVQAGKRIPRRGEIGMRSDEIEKYEVLGYQMSGSRHARMNAVRVRKESQVYTAEEKSALAQLNFEEKQKREGEVMGRLKDLVERTQDRVG